MNVNDEIGEAMKLFPREMLGEAAAHDVGIAGASADVAMGRLLAESAKGSPAARALRAPTGPFSESKSASRGENHRGRRAEPRR